jgi:predicted ester cyclase
MFPLLLLVTLLVPGMASINPTLCTSPVSPAYEKEVRIRSATFHQNFDKGPAGKKANGALVSLSIDWVSQNVNTLGRQAFVNGLLAFGVPFPDLKISDNIILNDGNTAAIFYYFQGHQTGAFNGVPASGAAIEALNGELMVFDNDVLLNRLISINEIDTVELEITGQKTVNHFEKITLIENPQTSIEFRQKIKNIAAQFNNNFNLGKTSANTAFLVPDVEVLTDQGLHTGKNAVLSLFSRYAKSHPDLIAHDEYILGDGHFTAVEWVWQGTFTGPFIASNGSTIQPTGKSYRMRGLRWMQHNEEGLVTKVWQVTNNNDLITNIQN